MRLWGPEDRFSEVVSCAPRVHLRTYVPASRTTPVAYEHAQQVSGRERVGKLQNVTVGREDFHTMNHTALLGREEPSRVVQRDKGSYAAS